MRSAKAACAPPSPQQPLCRSSWHGRRADDVLTTTTTSAREDHHTMPLLCKDERAGDEQPPLAVAPAPAPAPAPARAKGGTPLPEPTPAGSGLCDDDACGDFLTAFGTTAIIVVHAVSIYVFCFMAH